MARRRVARPDTAELRSMTEEVAALERMSMTELADKYLELLGERPRSHNRQHLVQRVAHAVQERREGGLSRRAKAQIRALQSRAPRAWQERFDRAAANRVGKPDRPPPPTPPPPAPAMTRRTRDPRLPPPGSAIARVHDGVEHTIVVGENTFEYQGRVYKSLSQVARAITGVQWNGYTFFQLGMHVAVAEESEACP
jgi:DUF2924 family protein